MYMRCVQSEAKKALQNIETLAYEGAVLEGQNKVEGAGDKPLSDKVHVQPSMTHHCGQRQLYTASLAPLNHELILESSRNAQIFSSHTVLHLV